VSLEHFISGAATGGPRAYVHLLGHRASLTDIRSKPSQANRLYKAETGLREAIPENYRFISPNSARDFVGEAIFHPAMDEIPGIKELRTTFSPDHITFPNIIGEAVDGSGRVSAGRVNIDGTMKLQPMSEQFLRYFNEKNPGKLQEMIKANPMVDFRQMLNKVRLATVTHETSHLLLNNLSNDIRREVNGVKVGHEWPMARTHVHVVRRMLGREYAEGLKSHYEKLGVDFGNKSI
jgi:hypothetical protein